MSFDHLRSVWPLQLPLARKFVLVVLAEMANEKGECFPAVMTLANRCCTSERTIQNALSDLERDGYIRRVFRTGRSTTYALTDSKTWPAHAFDPRAAVDPDGAATPAAPAPPQQLHPTPANAAPPQDLHPRTSCTPPPQDMHPGGAAAAGEGAGAAPITTTQQPNEPPIEPLQTTAAHFARSPSSEKTEALGKTRRQKPKPTTAAGFDEFWDVYPRKLSKHDALKAWNKIAPDEALRSEIMRGLSAQLPALEVREPQFVPYPASWLNGKRWTDEPEPEPLASMSKRMGAVMALEAMKSRSGRELAPFERAPLPQFVPRPRTGEPMSKAMRTLTELAAIAGEVTPVVEPAGGSTSKTMRGMLDLEELLGEYPDDDGEGGIPK